MYSATNAKLSISRQHCVPISTILGANAKLVTDEEALFSFLQHVLRTRSALNSMVLMMSVFLSGVRPTKRSPTTAHAMFEVATDQSKSYQ